ncbi:unnamed protein product, partial [Closterium sp. NIES-54]
SVRSTADLEQRSEDAEAVAKQQAVLEVHLGGAPRLLDLHHQCQLAVHRVLRHRALLMVARFNSCRARFSSYSSSASSASCSSCSSCAACSSSTSCSSRSAYRRRQRSARSTAPPSRLLGF